MIITWYGTAAISIETEHNRIAFDPFVPAAGSKINVCERDFERFPTIFLTHGHIDHIFSVPKLVKDRSTTIWCTKTPASTLAKKGVNPHQIHEIEPQEKIALEDIELQVFQGRHIRFDKALVRRTLLNPRMIRYIHNIPWFVRQNAVCKENGETAAYLIKAESKSILLLGSLGLDPSISYPIGVDLLVLPFQGATDLVTPGMEIIERINPKRVLVDHFDDTFPPISNTISLDGLASRMRDKRPDIELLIPRYKEPILL